VARLLGISTLVAAAAMVGAAVPTTADQGTFRAGVVLLTIDVQVTPAKDGALREFGPRDFEVTVSGRKRSVASAVLLHLDEGSVIPNPPRFGQGPDTECIFGFHRRNDRPTAHYLLGIQPIDSDRGAKEVHVKSVDTVFATQWLVWRMPIR
jgi:hypothetical protein